MHKLEIIKPQGDKIKVIASFPDSLFLDKLEFYYNKTTKNLVFTCFWHSVNDSYRNGYHDAIFETLRRFLIALQKSGSGSQIFKHTDLANKMVLDKFTLLRKHGMGDTIHAHDEHFKEAYASEFYPHFHNVFNTNTPEDTVHKLIKAIEYFQTTLIEKEFNLLLRAFIDANFKPGALENMNVSIEECISTIDDEKTLDILNKAMKDLHSLKQGSIVNFGDIDQLIQEISHCLSNFTASDKKTSDDIPSALRNLTLFSVSLDKETSASDSYPQINNN